jgi:hypothetical protein
MARTGTEFAVAGLGILLVWSGISNKGFLTSVRDVVQGVEPTAGPEQNLLTPSSAATSAETTGDVTQGITSSGSPTSGTTDAQNQALGQQMAAAYGWGSGSEWTAFNNIVMAESGWDDEAANPSSDARGIAQNINGWSQSYQAGNAAQQIAWMLSYIKQRYGDPETAWAFHLANGWY